MVTRRDIYQQVDEQRRRQRDIGTFEQRLARGERRVANRSKAIGNGVRRGGRYVGKHRRKLRRKPVQVVAGMAGRTAVAATVGAAHTVGYTAKKAGQGYRKARPKVAGLANRAGNAAYAYSRAYGGKYGEKAAEMGRRTAASARKANRKARSQAVRSNARIRTQRRRVAGRMQHRAELYRQQKQQRLAKIVDTAAGGLAPKRRVAVRCTCGATFHTQRRAANHQCREAIRAENAAIERARNWQPVAGQKRPNCGMCRDTGMNGCGCCECRCVIERRSAITAPKNTTSKASNTNTGGNAMKPNGNARTGKYIPAAGFEPADYEEWMGFLYAKAAQHKNDADGLQDLAERMDSDEGMDPRTLLPLYMGAEAQQTTAQSYITAYAEFWKLYQNRVEEEGNSGRTMKDESKFFGKK